MTEAELQNLALRAVAFRVTEMLDGEYDVVPGAAVNQWDPHLKRHTFTQSAVVWRSFDAVRMTVTAAGEVIAFFDRISWSRWKLRSITRRANSPAQGCPSATSMIRSGNTPSRGNSVGIRHGMPYLAHCRAMSRQVYSPFSFCRTKGELFQPNDWNIGPKRNGRQTTSMPFLTTRITLR